MLDLTVMIKPVSSACNMRCRYCFYADVAEHRQQASMGVMTYETLENIVRRAMRYAQRSVTFLFQGGEPTLAGADFYRKLIEFQKKYNARGITVHNSIQTNGYCLSEALLDILEQEHFLVGVSFDGTAKIHDQLRLDPNGRGTSGVVLESIRKLQSRNIEFNILCVVNRYVAEHPREVFENLAPYGYIQYISCIDPFEGTTPEFSLTPQAYGTFLAESFKLYYDAWRKGHYVSVRNFDNYVGILMGRPPENCGMCGRCAQYYLIEADGSVYPCDFYVLDQWKLGNINDDSFFRLEKSELAAVFRKASWYVDENCKNCPYFGLCRGGCRRDREPFADDHPRLNKWCESYRDLFDQCFEQMKQMATGLMQGGER